MTERNIPEGKASLESLEDTVAGHQDNMTGSVLQGKLNVLSESKESRTQYTLWMK